MLNEMVWKKINMDKLCSNRENSIVIEPSTSNNAVWKGDEWSYIPVNIKLHSSFLRLVQKVNRQDLKLTPSIVNTATGEIFLHDDQKIIIGILGKCLTRRGNTSRQTNIPLQAFTKILVSVKKEFLSENVPFRVRVDVSSNCHDPIPKDLAFYGLSNLIKVYRYSLCLKQHFLRNKHALHLVDDYFAWFAKSGGDTSGLVVDVFMVDEDGTLVTNHKETIPLKTELIYSDGIAAPRHVMSSRKIPDKGVKGRSSLGDIAQSNILALYKELTENPILGPTRPVQTICFRIEEVSFYHSSHSGFKIRVSLVNTAQMIVRPAVLQETLVVLSKPKIRLPPRICRESGVRFDRNQKVTDQNCKLSSLIRPDKRSKISIVEDRLSASKKECKFFQRSEGLGSLNLTASQVSYRSELNLKLVEKITTTDRFENYHNLGRPERAENLAKKKQETSWVVKTSIFASNEKTLIRHHSDYFCKSIFSPLRPLYHGERDSSITSQISGLSSLMENFDSKMYCIPAYNFDQSLLPDLSFRHAMVPVVSNELTETKIFRMGAPQTAQVSRTT